MGTFILTPKQTMVPGFPVNNFYTKEQSDAKFAPIGGVSGYTPGSVIFANTDGTLTQNNANFFFDNANSRLGLGTVAPGSIFTIEQNALGGTAGADTTSIILRNTTVAASGLQQVTPAIIFSGNGWGTTTPASANVSFRLMGVPVQSTTNPLGNFVVQSSVNGAAYVTTLTVSSGGTIVGQGTASTSIAYQTNPTATNSNLVVITTGMATNSLASLLYGGATSTQYRMYMRGGTSTTASNNVSISNFMIGTQAFTTGAAGTHAWASQLVIKPLTITVGTAGVTNSASLYIEDAATGATNNYALYVASGATSMQGAIINKITTVADTAYTVLISDYIIAYTTLTAGRAVTLPTTATVLDGQKFIIKDEAGTAGANTITITPASGTIDGAVNKTITTNYGVLRIYKRGSNFFTW